MKEKVRLIKLEKVNKKFKDFEINIDFEMFKGEIYGLIGKSGSGKSSILKIIQGLLKYDEGKILSLVLENQKGTCVFMELSNFSHKTAKEIFDAYSNVDGGFVKTKIPLKNIFDTSPVSRSQAKRICNRLDKFKEVIVDFDEIGWLGQGFAHQLFVVFANSHPDIILTPINMNEDVTKMYNHVKNTNAE